MPDEPIGAIVLMGVSGCGKTTVGERLAARLGWEFVDGDDFHLPENVRKMAAGTPLDDADRAPWLDALRAHLDRRLADAVPVVVACSALKATYRQRLVGGEPRIRVVYLRGSFETIAERLRRRAGHFMPPELLRSQFDALEEPTDAWVVDIDPPPEEIVDAIVERVAP